MEVAREITKQGITIEVIDLRSIKPLDIATVATSVKKTHHCILVEEGHSFSGICSEIGFQIQEHCFEYLDAPVMRICQRESPLPYSKILEHETLPNKDRIIHAVKDMLSI